jgi:O-antigen ligase
VLQLIARKPWGGWGWGELDFAHYETLYPGARFCDILDNAHNLPLHLAVELGVPVAMLACGLAGWAIWRARPWREADPGRQLAWCVLGVILLHSLFEYPLWYGPFQLAALFAAGMLAPGVGASLLRPAMAAGIAVACVAAGTYAAWDYHRVTQIYVRDEDRSARYRDDTLAHVRKSRLFRGQAEFAELTLTPLVAANAQWTYDASSRLLHFSPEPRVIERVIESATMLERYDEAVLHLARYRAAFPSEYQAWRRAQKVPMQPPGG